MRRLPMPGPHPQIVSGFSLASIRPSRRTIVVLAAGRGPSGKSAVRLRKTQAIKPGVMGPSSLARNEEQTGLRTWPGDVTTYQDDNGFCNSWIAGQRYQNTGRWFLALV